MIDLGIIGQTGPALPIALKKQRRISVLAHTRARRKHPQTSHDAAKTAEGSGAAVERFLLLEALKDAPDGLTSKEAAAVTGIPWDHVHKRLSEIEGIYMTQLRRERCAVWRRND